MRKRVTSHKKREKFRYNKIVNGNERCSEFQTTIKLWDTSNPITCLHDDNKKYKIEVAQRVNNSLFVDDIACDLLNGKKAEA